MCYFKRSFKNSIRNRNINRNGLFNFAIMMDQNGYLQLNNWLSN